MGPRGPSASPASALCMSVFSQCLSGVRTRNISQVRVRVAIQTVCVCVCLCVCEGVSSVLFHVGQPGPAQQAEPHQAGVQPTTQEGPRVAEGGLSTKA